MDTTQTEPQNESQLQLFDPQNEPREKVEILSVIGDQEKSWSIDKYHLMVGCSILSVVFIMGGIVWLASGSGKGSSSANPLPTGELQFSDKQGGVKGANDLPYPQVRQAGPLLPEKNPSKAASKIPTPTTAEDSPTATPTPTSKPNDPTATPNPTPTPSTGSEPTATPAPTDTPTPSPTP